MKKIIFYGLGVIFMAVIAFFVFSSNVSSFKTIDNFEEDIKVYKSQSCGCCEIYVNYLQRNVNKDVKVINYDYETLESKKDNLGIPKSLRSCHTTVIGNYFIEGHVPLEAIEKLLNKTPDIKGIAMPGMPDGSPGMPGNKIGDFIIYLINRDNSYEEFMRI